MSTNGGMDAAQVKTRSELKAFFKNGCMPDETHFASLIDAFVHRADPPPAPVSTPPAAQPPAPRPTGWQRMAGRIGAYDPDLGPQQIECAVNLTGAGVLADGNWHVIVRGLYDCYAFELVASASGRVNSCNHAVTHAIVLTSFSGDAGSIRQTASYKGWDFRRKIRLKWVKRDGAYDLCIGTGTGFGKDDQGHPVMIQYHLTRLW
jgi:hypothetical protein